MLQIVKIINAGNCELVIKWSDGKLQTLDSRQVQSLCPCARCQDGKGLVDKNVKILSFQMMGRFGLKVRFSSGCQSGIYSLNMLRSWLKDL